MSETRERSSLSVRDATPLVVMISGSGRLLQTILTAIESGRLRARVNLCIASRRCPGLEIAAAHKVASVIESGQIPAHRLAELARSAGVGPTRGYVVLAGYLQRINIPAGFAQPNWRIINIHPALLPAFGGKGMHGLHVHEAVVKAGAKVSGCTVHYVDEQYDHGPTLMQRSCEVRADDSAESLAARVFELEKAAIVDAIAQLCEKDAGAAGDC